MDLAVESDSCILSNYSNKESYRNDDVKRKVTNFRCRNPTPLDRAGLGLSTFCAAHHPVESCGSNGLPLTPNSVQILGKFQTLSQLEHPNLCTYVEVCRIQHGMYIPSKFHSSQKSCFFSPPLRLTYCIIVLFLERVIIVSEHYSTTLQTLIQKKKVFGLDFQIHVAKSILEALQYLHSHKIVHRNFHSKNVLISSEGRVKLSAYGMYFMTQSSTLVSFPIG